VFVKPTALPCVESARFDEKAGFCLPTGAPTPIPLPPVTADPFEGRPRIERGDRTESDPSEDFPFRSEDTEPEERDTPEPRDTPER
jgi:hypothetical protein